VRTVHNNPNHKHNNQRRNHVKPHASIELDSYGIIARAVEEGIAYGWNRAHKHTEKPEPHHIKNEINNAIMNAISEIIIWPET
jgi:hypothetical protein